MSPHTVTGHFTGCTFHSSIKIDLACSHSAFTSASGRGLHSINCSICRSRSDCDAAMVFAERVSCFWWFRLCGERVQLSSGHGCQVRVWLGIEEREREREKCEHGCPNWGFFRGVPGFMCIYVIGINIWRGFFIQIGPLPNWEGNTFVFIG